jgi:hypothetical protein
VHSAREACGAFGFSGRVEPKMPKSKYWKWILVVAGVILLLIIGGFGERYVRLSSSDRGFESYTGVSLPPDVSVSAHASEVNDAFFHETHYWTLIGPVSSLRILASSFGLERSDDDAKWALPDMKMLFGVTANPADIVEAYEGSPDGGRDRWLMIMSNGQGAVFVY